MPSMQSAWVAESWMSMATLLGLMTTGRSPMARAISSRNCCRPRKALAARSSPAVSATARAGPGNRFGGRCQAGKPHGARSGQPADHGPLQKVPPVECSRLHGRSSWDCRGNGPFAVTPFSRQSTATAGKRQAENNDVARASCPWRISRATRQRRAGSLCHASGFVNADNCRVGPDPGSLRAGRRAQAHHDRLEITLRWACARYAIWSHPTATAA